VLVDQLLILRRYSQRKVWDASACSESDELLRATRIDVLPVFCLGSFDILDGTGNSTDQIRKMRLAFREFKGADLLDKVAPSVVETPG